MGKSKTSKKVKAEEPKKVEKVEKTKGKKAAKAEEEKKKQQKKKEEKPVPMEEDSSSSEESSSEEEVKPTKKAATPTKKAAKKESSSEEDSSSEESEEEAKPAKKAAKKETSSEDSSSEESSEEEETKPAADNKRKRDEDNGAEEATNGAAEESFKKAKTEEAAESANFFIGNLPWSAEEDTVKQFFESQGVSAVLAVRLITDRDTGRKKGFGYVEVAPADADAVLALAGSDFEGRELKVDRANSRPANADQHTRPNKFEGDSTPATDGNVFLGNLSFDSTEDSLWGALEQFGTIKAVRIVYDRETQKPRGFGYCEFEDVESANKAISASNTIEVDGRQIRINAAAARTGGGGFRGGRGGRGGSRGGFRGSSAPSFAGKKTSFD